MRSQRIVLLISALLLHLDSLFNCELCASVDELSKGYSIMSQITIIIDRHIKLKESKLAKLRHLKRTLLDAAQHEEKLMGEQEENSTSMYHPVGAFTNLNRIVKAIDEIQLFVEDSDKSESSQLELQLEQFDTKHGLLSSEDLIGCGEALLRLQAFYHLDIDDLVEGKLISIHKDDELPSRPEVEPKAIKRPKMNSEDCFALGKIAYEDGQYSVSIKWFQKALELINSGKDEYGFPYDHHAQLVEILEYMAFAAYKNDQIRYSAQLTKLWLEKDPDNERAKANLEYYLEELDFNKQSPNRVVNLPREGRSLDVSIVGSKQDVDFKESVNKYDFDRRFNSSEYAVTDDKIVQILCRNPATIRSNHDKCHRKLLLKAFHAGPEIKIETLHSSPNIVRVHDIITDYEAVQLRKLALPNLKRSTVQSKSGLVTTDFRIAKTAWLSSHSDPIVASIERRISETLNLNLQSSEDLQVVNYGLGGFYGPHLDSARESESEINNDSLRIDSLAQNDRLATVLIYLNEVAAGGSTVFPKLGLTVEPIARSAVVWFNILRNGLTDERTLHTGCPVLLGSKWIATKWPRERANIFLRPCGLKQEEQ